jgi:molybdopterin-guanine dinucleotide biosynthesis protein A
VIISTVRSGISTAILVGGRARRFGGADNTALRVGGSRIIDRQLAVPTVIPDIVPGAGTLGGAYIALQRRSLIEASLDRGALRVSNVAGERRVLELGLDVLAAYDPDGRLFVNVNTPHDDARPNVG